MLELPESNTIAKQINSLLIGKSIKNVIAGYTPHKMTWYSGDPQDYDSLLSGKTIDNSRGLGSMLEIKAGPAIILLSDGVSLKYNEPREGIPQKHQLLIEFEDSSSITGSVQMYGGISCFIEGTLDNPYYKAAKEKPSPLSDDFDKAYFQKLISLPEVQKLSAKAFLATEQRIPGLGNGVLQDILWKSRIHPKRKINTLTAESKDILYNTITDLLTQMTSLRGRDSEKDLFGKNGGYKTMMGKNSAGQPCIACGGYIKKESYMGGSIYFCEKCQML